MTQISHIPDLLHIGLDLPNFPTAPYQTISCKLLPSINFLDPTYVRLPSVNSISSIELRRMADDWNTVTHIGKSRNGGNAGGQRQKVVKKSSDLNAAFRAGGVSTQKKATSANSVSVLSL